MPSRLPNKGTCIFAHLADGDYVGYVQWYDEEDDEYGIHWLLRPEEPNNVWDGSQLLKNISQGKIKVLRDNPTTGINIDKPKFGIGDLLIAETSKGRIVGYILHTIIRGHEVKLPDSSKQHCQFFYRVNIPKQRILEQCADGATIEYDANAKVSEIPEVLIDWGIETNAIQIQRRANKKRE